jgi:hypothetical protein
MTFPAFKSRSEKCFWRIQRSELFLRIGIKDNQFVPSIVITNFKIFENEAELDTSLFTKEK